MKIYFVARFKGMGIDWNFCFLCQVSYEILFLSPLKFLPSTKLLLSYFNWFFLWLFVKSGSLFKPVFVNSEGYCTIFKNILEMFY